MRKQLKKIRVKSNRGWIWTYNCLIPKFAVFYTLLYSSTYTWLWSLVRGVTLWCDPVMASCWRPTLHFREALWCHGQTHRLHTSLLQILALSLASWGTLASYGPSLCLALLSCAYFLSCTWGWNGLPAVKLGEGYLAWRRPLRSVYYYCLP